MLTLHRYFPIPAVLTDRLDSPTATDAFQRVTGMLAALVVLFGVQQAKAGFTTLDDPLATAGTFATGISGSNIVGAYNDLTGRHGFLYHGTSYTTLDHPLAGSFGTFASGISGSNIVGADLVLSLNTGFDNSTNSLLAPYTVDAKYQVTGPDSSTYFPQARDATGLPSTYVAAPAGSRWDYLVITPTSHGADFVPVGNYDFRTTVDLTGFDAASAQITGLQVAADNAFLAVEINGQTIFSRNPTGDVIEEFHSLLDVGNLGLGDFHSGLNTVDFIIFNQGFGGDGSQIPSPSAFLAVGDIEASPAAVPEPSSLALFGMATATFAGYFGWRRRKQLVTV